MSWDTPPHRFAGEVFLSLAAEGRLVVDAELADEMIAGLERTLAQIRSRQQIIGRWNQLPAQHVDDLPAESAQDIVDAVFTDQLTPGHFDRAAAELPKYIEALRRASGVRPSSGQSCAEGKAQQPGPEA